MLDLQPRKIRHHYVPVCLTKRFCLQNKTLFLYDLKKNNILKSDPRNSFVESCYHSVQKDEGGMDHNKIENLLMPFEGSGIRAITRYVQSKGLVDKSTKEEIASFWSLQYLRVPIRREEAEEALKANIRMTSDLCEKSGLITLPPELKKYGNSFNDVCEIVITLPQVTLMALGALDKCMAVLMNMNWCLIEFENMDYLALSDNPCSFFSDVKTQNYGLSFATPRVEVILPIDLNHCILASWKPLPPFLKGNKKMLHEINRRTALYAQRFLAYPENSEALKHFFRKYSIGTPKGDVSVLGNYMVSRSNVFKGDELRKRYDECFPLF